MSFPRERVEGTRRSLSELNIRAEDKRKSSSSTSRDAALSRPKYDMVSLCQILPLILETPTRWLELTICHYSYYFEFLQTDDG